MLRQNKVIGLAIGERSLVAAELTAGDKPVARALAEFVYPQGVSPQNPDALGKALAPFLQSNGFTAKSAVVGLPARWLVVKPKDVPPTDADTRAEMLRLQAEGEFSSELKDLIYDYASAEDNQSVTSVLLIATKKEHIDSASAMCEAAGLTAIAVTSTAVALGAATGQTMGKDAMVLAVTSAGAELTAHSGGAASAIRHLRGGAVDRPFIGELRRAVSSMPTSDSARELVMWNAADADSDTDSLSKTLGFKVRSGDLPALGIESDSSNVNGQGPKYAAAIALGMTGIGAVDLGIDFLHSRLAPPKPAQIPRWVIFAAIAAVLVIGICIAGYNSLQAQQAKLDAANNQLAGMKDQIATAAAFVNDVTFAQGWQGGNPRYIACIRDVTSAIPDDKVTYATSLNLSEVPRPQAGAKVAFDPDELLGKLSGKTSSQQEVLVIQQRLLHMPGFSEVELPTSGAGNGNGKNPEVAFSITFKYTPPKVKK